MLLGWGFLKIASESPSRGWKWLPGRVGLETVPEPGFAPATGQDDGVRGQVSGAWLGSLCFHSRRAPRARAESGAGEADSLWLDLSRLVGEPAVPIPEGLGLGALGVPHNPEPIVVGVEANDAVIPDTELLPAAGVVEVLGGEAQESRIGMDGFLPLDGAAPEGAGAVVHAPGHPDADAVGYASALRAHHGLQIIHALDDRD